jgi:hypothetical protein
MDLTNNAFRASNSNRLVKKVVFLGVLKESYGIAALNNSIVMVQQLPIISVSHQVTI